MSKTKLLVVRVELSEADYAEARQVLSDKEIRECLKDDGLSGLREYIKTTLAHLQSRDRAL